jgi:hypothetical protein
VTSYSIIDTHSGAVIYSTFDRVTANLILNYVGRARYALRHSPTGDVPVLEAL